MRKMYITVLFLMLCLQSIHAQNITVTATVINCSCYGAANGAIFTMVTGGSGNYYYDWGNYPNIPNLVNLPAGTYSVLVTDLNNPTATATGVWVVMQPALLTVNGTMSPASCSGNDGCISLNVTGGVTPYYYLWSNGVTTMNICGLACGVYSVTVIDANGCEATKSWEITTNMTLTTVITKNCDPLKTKIDLTTHDGCPISSYYWSLTGSTWTAPTEDISNLTCGTYCVTVTDINGCHTSSCWDFDDLFLNEQICVAGGGNNGSITLHVSCGTPGYTYQWSYLQNPGLILPQDPAIFNLGAGWYCVTVTDSHTPPRTKTCCFEVGAKKSTCLVSYVQNITVPSGKVVCYDELGTLYVAGNGTIFLVANQGNATLIAGEKIKYMPGTTIYSGGLMHGYIATNGQYCPNKSNNEGSSAGGMGPDAIGQTSFSENQVFKVYPNPTPGTFILEFKGEIPLYKAIVDVVGMLGKKIFTQVITGEPSHKFSLSDKPAGIYFIHVITGDKSETAKIIKR
jgi:hypothetical protein